MRKILNAKICAVTEKVSGGLRLRAFSCDPDIHEKAGDFIGRSSEIPCFDVYDDKNSVLVESHDVHMEPDSKFYYLGFPLFTIDREIFGSVFVFNVRSGLPLELIQLTLHDIARLIEGDLDLYSYCADISESAYLDPLTGLQNRRGFYHLARLQVARIKREQLYAGLIFIDIDGLKAVNDTHGHAMGDRLIVALAEVLKQTLRRSELVARYGGDEFVVFAAVKAPAELNVLEKRLRQAISHTLISDAVRLSASIGAVSVPAKALGSLDDLIAVVDREMYKEKKGGK